MIFILYIHRSPFIDHISDTMRHAICIFYIVLGVFYTAQSQSIEIDEANALVSFLFVDDDVEGTLSEFEFTGSIDLDAMDTSVFSGSVLMETLDTDNWFRDRHLRSKKYFNNKNFPRMSFTSTSISGSGDEFVVRGDLTIKGIKKPVAFTFRKLPGKLLGTSVINASHFDILIHNDTERNMTKITITLPYIVN